MRCWSARCAARAPADFDKGDKFDAYRQLPSLREYLILDNRRPQATLFHLGDDGEWRYLVFSVGAEVPLPSVGLRLVLDQVYRGLTLDPDPARG